ncbi:MAG: F0F1 ATP synthase subunit gamma [Candidatus Saccharimonadia bacterium]
MQKASAIQIQLDEIITIEELTDVFESLSSTQIAKIKDKVELSTKFFERLWQVYSALRVDPTSQMTYVRPISEGKNQVFVMITAESGLNGDIDDRLINAVLNDFKPEETDIICIGQHGAGQLRQRRIKYTNYFAVPVSENYVDVSPILEAVAPYPEITVYYESYASLGKQEIKKINLISSVREMSADVDPDKQLITGADTVFEPSLDVIVDQMEITMVGLALSQVILMSSLAQYASRFNAMVLAKRRALEMLLDYRLDYYRAKRYENDKRLREMLVGVKKKRRARK